MVPVFYKQVARELATKFAGIFRHLVRGGSWPACWRLAGVVAGAKGLASSDVGEYRPMSKVFEKIVTGKFSHLCRETGYFLFSFCIGGA